MQELGHSSLGSLAMFLTALSACAGVSSAPRATVAEHEAAALAATDPRKAEEHRAAAQALLSTERAQCSGQEASLGVEEPFLQADEIDRVSRVLRRFGARRGMLHGATIQLRHSTDEGATRRCLGCYLARIAVAGSTAPALSGCPLAVPGVRAEVKADVSRVRVEVTSEDWRGAKEVWARALRLSHGRVCTEGDVSCSR
jgi:hypothetical protein